VQNDRRLTPLVNGNIGDAIMDVKDTIPILFERFNASVSQWNFQMAVILGLLAFLAATSSSVRGMRLQIGLVGAYVIFAGINLTVLLQIEAERRVIEQVVRGKLRELPQTDALANLSDVIATPSNATIWAMHLVGDVAVIAAIFLIPTFLRRRAQTKLK
jgi:hypothetical protein